MSAERRITAVTVIFIFAAVVFALASYSCDDPSERLLRLEVRIVQLSVRPRPYRWSDRLIGLLHTSDPLMYYQRQAERQKRTLIAAGRLIEFKIPDCDADSERAAARSLSEDYERTGAPYFIDFDVTNHFMLVACRPGDVQKFRILK
jgi:hypothetical protein